MRDGFGPDSTWIQFNSGPYLSKHQHLDQNHFVIYRKGYLATESGADYTDTESPHYLNYYRRTIAHNSMAIPGRSPLSRRRSACREPCSRNGFDIS